MPSSWFPQRSEQFFSESLLGGNKVFLSSQPHLLFWSLFCSFEFWVEDFVGVVVIC